MSHPTLQTGDQPDLRASARDSADPLRLLCESCGYPLDGLERGGQCPECGRSREGSLPIRRRGSRWQRKPSLASLVLTDWQLLRRPVRFWGNVRLHEPRVAMLLFLNIGVAALLPTLALLLSMCGPVRHLNARYLGLFFLGGMALMAVLTGIEFLGLSFFARQRGWRVPRDASFVIVSHAAAGWIVSGLAVSLVWVSWTAIDFYRPSLLATPLGSIGTLGDALAPAIAVAFVSGMIVFSLLAGAGWRALRYANRLAPGEV